MACRLNARTEASPALIVLADANANLRSGKAADIVHRAFFLSFLEQMGLSEAICAAISGRNTLLFFDPPKRRA